MSRPDFSLALDHLSQDPCFAEVVKEHEPPDWEITENSYQLLSRIIVFQQLSGKAATTIWNRYIELIQPDWDFSQPNLVLQKSVEELRGVGLSRQKATYLHDLSLHFDEEKLSHQMLLDSGDEDVSEMLLAVKGIGPWCVDMFMMFGLCRMDVWPVGDLGVRKGVQQVLGREEPLGKQELQDVAEPWKPYRSVAAHYCWRVIDIRNPNRD